VNDPELDRRAQELRDQDRKAADLREKYRDWEIFRIAGGWGAIRNHTEIARTANTLDELAAKLEEFAA
jgi:hypothetical protein